MSKALEALKRIRQETCPATYMADFDKNECCDVIEQSLQRLEAIDNANPSGALEILDDFKNGLVNKEIGMVMFQQYWFFNQIEKVKQALLKVQEQKQYLKWEDLEFGVPTSLQTTMKVKMGDTQYLLSLRISFSDVKSVVLRDNNLKPILHLFEKEKQFFNDLHLERVEE